MAKRQFNLNPQQGMMLIMLVFIVGLAATVYLVHALNANTVKIERDKKTTAALAEAKAALIGWSTGHATMPGALPCPDDSNTGVSGGCNTGFIGHLPWKTLGINDLRDGSGECLWYALSPEYRNNITVASRISTPINSSIPGTITVKGADGTNFPSPVNPVIAVIIAPGAPLAVQNRTSAGSTVCGGNFLPSNYLDTAQGVNNSTGNHVPLSNNYTFITGAASNAFNDRLIYIKAEDLYGPVRKRIADELTGVGTPGNTGFRKYYVDNQVYPWAGDASGDIVANSTSGPVPYNALTLTPSSLRSWMINNGWMLFVTYQIGTNFNPDSSASFPQHCTAGNCITVRGIDVPASVTVGGGASTWTTRVCESNAVMTSCPPP
jgi:hypothetical protein